MNILLHHFIQEQAENNIRRTALIYKSQALSYGELYSQLSIFAAALGQYGLQRNDRVAIFLPKQIETVVAIFGTSAAGGIFVPINPSLKPKQVAYILKNCNVRMLITSPDRKKLLSHELLDCPELEKTLTVGEDFDNFMVTGQAASLVLSQAIDQDVAAILYTSGSTGMPKGVVLSHRNMVLGAESVTLYLENTPDDIILSVLPLSFDAGLSQLTTAFCSGASVVLMDYLMPRDILRQAIKYDVTGITAVPPLWIQLSELTWPTDLKLRYIASTGGKMPVSVTHKIQKKKPNTSIFLMYGLTEAFRSTFLDPHEVNTRPDSIGKAIPNAEVLIVRPDGSLCDTDEPGELVHRGGLVGLGYWNDQQRTKQHFKPAPGQPEGLVNPEIAVWSGDTVKRDAEGFLYFIGRHDDMIKTSGFRISPSEIEECIFASGLVREVLALGVEDVNLGQVIWVVVSLAQPNIKSTINSDAIESAIISHCRTELPGYMTPQKVIEWPQLPKNSNGKFDRKTIISRILKDT